MSESVFVWNFCEEKRFWTKCAQWTMIFQFRSSNEGLNSCLKEFLVFPFWFLEKRNFFSQFLHFRTISKKFYRKNLSKSSLGISSTKNVFKQNFQSEIYQQIKMKFDVDQTTKSVEKLSDVSIFGSFKEKSKFNRFNLGVW